MIVAGIDSGKRGAIVVIDTESTKAFYEKLKYDDEGILKTHLGVKYRFVDKFIMEQTHGRGGWGANKTFMMGNYYGQMLKSVVDTGKMYELVQPNEWTGLVHREVESNAKGKEKSLLAYHQYFPHDPVGLSRNQKGYHDGVIDALLIALFEVLRCNGVIREWTFNDEEEEPKWNRKTSRLRVS